MLLDLSPLKNPEFRKLYLSQAISMIGTQMSIVTIPFQVYAITKSTAHTGLVSTVELLCLVATVFWGGALADLMDRRRMLVVAECVMATLVGVLAINSLLPQPSLILIYIIAGCLAACSGFHRPAFEALTPVLVSKAELARVSPLMMLKMIIGALIGPSVAGLILAAVGPFFTYSIDVISFLLSLFFLLQIKVSLNESKDEGKAEKVSIIRDVKEAVLFLKQRHEILGSYVVDFCAMVFCMPQVLFPALAAHFNQESSLGILYGAVAFGSFLMSLVSGWTVKIKRLGLGIAFAAGGWALSIVGAGFAPSFWYIPLGLALAGAFDGLSGIFRLTMWNETIPDRLRGRMASFGMLSYMSGPLLGNSLVGLMASFVGLQEALLLGGGIGFVTVVIISVCLPQFRAYRSPA